jgi:hypothetical protein
MKPRSPHPSASSSPSSRPEDQRDYRQRKKNGGGFLSVDVRDLLQLAYVLFQVQSLSDDDYKLILRNVEDHGSATKADRQMLAAALSVHLQDWLEGWR